MKELEVLEDFMEVEFTLVRNRKVFNCSAENSPKADQYSTPNSSNSFFIFLSRVTLGSPFIAQSSHNDLRRPPERKDKKCLYDSLLGKMPGYRYREFVVYDKSQCYPEFLIEYKRL